MKNLALIDYIFMFDPAETWSNLFQFEADLAKFFDERGFEASAIKTVDGGSGRRIFIIRKKELPMPEIKNKVGRPQSIGSKFKEMSERKLRKPALEFMGKK